MLPVLAVLAAAVLFGTTGTSQALGPADTTPLAVGAARLVIGGAAVAALALPIAAHRRRIQRAAGRPQPRLDRRSLLLMGVTGISLAAYQPLFFLGAARNGVAVGTVIALGAAPVLAGVLEWLLTRRTPSATWSTATVLAAIGVVLLGVGGGAGTTGADPVGVLGSLGAGAAFAVFANAQRALLSAGWDPFAAVGAMGLGSGLVGSLIVPFVDVTWAFTPRGAVMALWLGIATIAAAYTLFSWGLQRLTAATAATLTLGEPLTAALLGIALLGESLSPLAIAGLGVLAAGLLVLAWGSRAPQDPHPYPLET